MSVQEHDLINIPYIVLYIHNTAILDLSMHLNESWHKLLFMLDERWQHRPNHLDVHSPVPPPSSPEELYSYWATCHQPGVLLPQSSKSHGSHQNQVKLCLLQISTSSLCQKGHIALNKRVKMESPKDSRQIETCAQEVMFTVML